jgi:hypothetical protein
MIEKVSNHSGASPVANLTPKAASTKTLCHTPFGDVMVNELSARNLTSTLLGGQSNRKSAPAVAKPAAVVPAAKPAVVVPATKPAVVALAAQAAAAAATVQPTAATATVKAAVAAQPAVAAATVKAAVAAAATAQKSAAAPAVQSAVADDDPAQNSAPTAESVFGPNPWIANPTGMSADGTSYSYNPFYFATAATAAQVAQMVGGTVVASDQLAAGGGYMQQQPNQMVKLADGTLINPGLVASFYTHGYPQSYIDMLVQNETQTQRT